MVTLRHKLRLSAPVFLAFPHTVKFFGEWPIQYESDPRLAFQNKEIPTIEGQYRELTFRLTLIPEWLDDPSTSQTHQWFGVRDIAIDIVSEEATVEATLAHDSFELRRKFFVAAIDVTSKFVEYCRLNLGQGLLRPPKLGDLKEREWLDADGIKFSDVRIAWLPVSIPGIPGSIRSLGSKNFAPEDLNRAADYIRTSREVEPHAELLCMARDAIHEADVMRAVLLMAIACEVAVKTKFFRLETLSSIAFDYLEEKRRVEVQVLELIDGVSSRAFGQSFKSVHRDQFRCIDYLFRARNKIAHRAQAIYRDDRAVIQTVVPETLVEWWGALDVLMQWLAAARPQSSLPDAAVSDRADG